MIDVEEFPAEQNQIGCIGLVWDRFLTGSTRRRNGDASEDVITTITAIHAADNTPSPNGPQIENIWEKVRPTVTARRYSSNGTLHGQAALRSNEAVASGLPAAIIFQDRRWRWTAPRCIAETLRLLTVVLVAGFVAGGITLGLGGRLVMRLAAVLSADELAGAMTENQRTVGRITLSGSVTLMFAGAIAGMALAVAYLGFRQWLPDQRKWRTLTTGLVYFSICGFLVLDGGDNTDYQRFGIAGINICLFTFLPFLFGLCIGEVIEHVDHLLPLGLYDLRNGRSSIFKILLGFATGLLTTLSLSFLVFQAPLQLFLLMLVLFAISRLRFQRLSLGTGHLMDWYGRSALFLPTAAGLVLTAYAVMSII